MATKAKASTASAVDTVEKDALQALGKIERAVAKHESGKLGAAAADLAAACKVYNQIKPWLTTALPLIERIPVYGKKIASAIRTLMQIADIACAA